MKQVLYISILLLHTICYTNPIQTIVTKTIIMKTLTNKKINQLHRIKLILLNEVIKNEQEIKQLEQMLTENPQLKDNYNCIDAASWNARNNTKIKIEQKINNNEIKIKQIQRIDKILK